MDFYRRFLVLISVNKNFCSNKWQLLQIAGFFGYIIVKLNPSLEDLPALNCNLPIFRQF